MQSTPDTQTLAGKMRFDPEYLQQFEAKMFIEGPQTTRRLTNFFVLLLLATTLNRPVIVNLRTIPTQSESSSRN